MVCPIVVPCYREGGPTCYVNLLEYKAYTYAAGKATEVPIPDMGHRLDGLGAPPSTRRWRKPARS